MFDEQAKTLLDKLRLSEAIELARSGSYSAAERLIAELQVASDPSIAIEALDLQARICIQQGRTGEAADCWRKALQQEPANLAYQAALARLSKLQRWPLWLGPVATTLVGAGIVVAGALALSWQARSDRAEFARLGQTLSDAVRVEGLEARRQMTRLAGAEQSASTKPESVEAPRPAAAESSVDIGAKLDQWASAQRLVAAQLKQLQMENRRLALEQRVLTKHVLDQAEALRHAAGRQDTLTTRVEQHRAASASLDASYPVPCGNTAHSPATATAMASTFECLAREWARRAQSERDPADAAGSVPAEQRGNRP